MWTFDAGTFFDWMFTVVFVSLTVYDVLWFIPLVTPYASAPVVAAVTP
jgi:hypothetical protein